MNLERPDLLTDKQREILLRIWNEARCNLHAQVKGLGSCIVMGTTNGGKFDYESFKNIFMQEITHYESSQGPLEITKMNIGHLANAIRKLERLQDQVGVLTETREAELQALKAEFALREKAKSDQGM